MMTPRVASVMYYETCNGGHPTTICFFVSVSSGQVKQVDYVSGINQPQGTLIVPPKTFYGGTILILL